MPVMINYFYSIIIKRTLKKPMQSMGFIRVINKMRQKFFFFTHTHGWQMDRMRMSSGFKWRFTHSKSDPLPGQPLQSSFHFSEIPLFPTSQCSTTDFYSATHPWCQLAMLIRRPQI